MEKKPTVVSKHIETYLDRLGYTELYGAMVQDVLLVAEMDGVTELLMKEADYKAIKGYLLASGVASWDWDKKTVWGITLTVK